MFNIPAEASTTLLGTLPSNVKVVNFADMARGKQSNARSLNRQDQNPDSSTDERFSKQNQRIGSLETKLNTVHSKLASIETTVNRIHEEQRKSPTRF